MHCCFIISSTHCTTRHYLDLDELFEEYAKSSTVPSYDHFAEAAAEAVPSYRAEKAKSKRSKCKKKGCGAAIPKDAVRVGSIDKDSGSYGRWHCLGCWRVPQKVWRGLTDPDDVGTSINDILAMEEVLLCGLAGLDSVSRRAFVDHCCDNENWASYKKRKIANEEEEERGGGKKKASAAAAGSAVANVEGEEEEEADDRKPAARANASSTASETANPDLPTPGVDGAADASFLKGKTFIITGSFPELVGGVKAKDAGVGDVKHCLESFEGKVTTRFSKTTNYLVVGRDAVQSKFSDAFTREVTVINLPRLKSLLMGGHTFDSIEDLPDLEIESFTGDAYQTGGAVETVPSPDPNATSTPQFDKKPAAKKPVAKKTKGAKKSADANGAASTSVVVTKPKVKIDDSVAGRARAALEVLAASRAAEAVPQLENGGASTAVAASSGTRERFNIPRPGADGIAGILNGKRVVLTGTFPEVGGGTGLNAGKDRMKEMIESFGGKVTGSVSGKTDYLIVGRDPGASKVGKAHQRGLPLMNILQLQHLLIGQTRLEDVATQPPPRITNYSSGYGNNGLLTNG